jgi:hypothetical protein
LFDDNEPAPGDNLRQQRPLFDDVGDDLALLRSGGVPPEPPDGEGDGSPADALLNAGLSSALAGSSLDAGDGFFDLQRRRPSRPFFNQAEAVPGDFMDIDCLGGLFGDDHSSSQAGAPAAVDVASSLASPDYGRTELQLGSGLRRVLVRSTAGDAPAHGAHTDAFAKAMASLDLDAGCSPSNKTLQHSQTALSQEQTAKSSGNQTANAPSPITSMCAIVEGNVSCRSILRAARKHRRTPLIGPWQVFEHESYGNLQTPPMQVTSAVLSGPWKELHAEAVRLVVSAQTSAMDDETER